jgi:hypothetical protein
MNINSYTLSRKWFDYCFENPEKINPSHTALYFFCIEHCNRLGWKEKFGLPTSMAKEAIGIHSYNTYIKTLNELIDFGFIKLIQKSKNQYSSNIIALSYFDKAPDKALDKALIKHSTKQGESTVQSIDSIIKQLNKEQLTNKQILELRNILDKNDTQFNFKNSIIDLGVEKQIAEDWIKVRAKKKAANTKTAFNGIKKQIEISGVPANECVKIAAEKSWQGLKAEWINNEIKSHPSNKSKNLLEI